MKNTIIMILIIAGFFFYYDKFVIKRKKISKISSPRISTIVKNGEEILLEKHTVQDNITVFDFYADWCGPCRRLTPELEKLSASMDNVYLKKINIKDWKTPIVSKYKIRSIPSVWVFDKKGQLRQKNLNSIKLIKKTIQQCL